MLVNRLLHAKILVDLGELLDAELEVADVLEAHPESLDALSLLARIKHMRGEISAAVACWAQIHARSEHSEHARMHLMSMLHMAQDPEKGAGEFLALGQHRLVRKPAAYLALDAAFQLFASRKPEEARSHCRSVAQRYAASDRDVYKLAVLAEAWMAEQSGELEVAAEILEALGRERGFENDYDRVIALVGLYESIGTPEKLEAAVNICRFLERVMDPVAVLGRLAVLYRRLEQPDTAIDYERRHLTAFRRGMHHVSLDEAAQVAARSYIPLAKLRSLVFVSLEPGTATDRRELALADAILGHHERARPVLTDLGEWLDGVYLGDLDGLEGNPRGAFEHYAEALRGRPNELRLVAWMLDLLVSHGEGDSAVRREAIRLLTEPSIAPVAGRLLEQRIELKPGESVWWARQAAMLEALRAPRDEVERVASRAEALRAVEHERAQPVGRVLAAAVYHFVGKAKGLIHEVWAGREPAEHKGAGGALARSDILGNLTDELKDNVRNTFMAVREYARAKFPHLTADILDYDYTYKLTKEDEPSGGTSAGVPTALAFLSVFLQRPVPSDLASTGWLVADAHDVMVLREVGEIEYKLRAAYHRNQKRLIVPRANRAELESSPLVPRAVCDEIVRYADNFDDAVKEAFGKEIYL